MSSSLYDLQGSDTRREQAISEHLFARSQRLWKLNSTLQATDCRFADPYKVSVLNKVAEESTILIRPSDGSWKWVKPYPESITVNIADVLQFWSAGYLKSSVHRVVAPPPDQAHIDRLGLLYFLRPAHDLKLKTLDSPLLKRLGLKPENDAADEIRAGDWVKARVKGNFEKAPPSGQKEKVVLNGVKALYYA